MTRKRKGNGLTGRWVAHSLEMLECPAWRSLTLAARLVLDRLEIEHVRHHGKRNGNLAVSYGQFLDYMGWTKPNSVTAAIQQLANLGFLEVLERGRWNGRRPSRYRLTYLPTPRSAAYRRMALIANPRVSNF